jgi:hypothetical protein
MTGSTAAGAVYCAARALVAAPLVAGTAAARAAELRAARVNVLMVRFTMRSPVIEGRARPRSSNLVIYDTS